MHGLSKSPGSFRLLGVWDWWKCGWLHKFLKTESCHSYRICGWLHNITLVHYKGVVKQVICAWCITLVRLTCFIHITLYITTKSNSDKQNPKYNKKARMDDGWRIIIRRFNFAKQKYASSLSKKKKVCKLFAFWSDKSMQVEIDIWQLQKKDFLLLLLLFKYSSRKILHDK